MISKSTIINFIVNYNQDYLKMLRYKGFKMIKKILITTLLCTLPAFAGHEQASFGLNINNEDLEVEGRMSLASRTSRLEYRNFFLDANFINGKDDTLTGVGFYVENSPHGYSNLEFGVGLRTVFSKNDVLDKSFIAVPITVSGKARMYLGNLPKSALGIKIAYAPTPLTFSDGESYLEYRLEADMQIIDNIKIYAGYRSIDTDYKVADVNFNSGAYVGFKFIF